MMTTTTETCPPTSTSSVATLRAALTRSSQAGLSARRCWRRSRSRGGGGRSIATSSRLAHPHQEPPPFANGGGAHSGTPWTTWLAARRPRRRQDPARRRMGARARSWRAALCRAAPSPHRAGRRDRARRARGDGRGRLRDPADVAARASGRSGCRRGGGSNGPTARWRRSFPPTIRSSCAGRNSTPPGATSWPSGAGRRRVRHAAIRLAARRAAAPAHHHHAAADRADQAAASPTRARAVTRAGDAGQCRAPVAAVSRRGAGALRRHAARPPGDRRRDHRRPRRTRCGRGR